MSRLPPWLVLAAVGTRAAPAALSVLLLGDARALLTPDSLQYLELAFSLASSGTFVRDGFPEIFRTPLFPMALVPGTWVGAPVPAAIALQVVLSVVVTALVFDTASLLTRSRRVAIAAAIVYLLEPGQPIWSSLVLADALMTAVMAALMWLAVRYPPAAGWGGAALIGLAAAAAAYVKPPGYVMGIILAMSVVAAWWRRAPARLVVSYVAVLLTVNAVALSGWHLRNYRVTGYAGFSTQFERAAFVAAPAALAGMDSGEGFAAERSRIHVPAGGEPEAQRVREFRRSGLPALSSSLPAYAWLHLKGSVLVLMDPGVYWWCRILGREVEPALVGSTFQNDGVRAALARFGEVGFAPLAVRGLLSLWPICVVGLWAATTWRHRATPTVLALGTVVVLWVVVSGGPHADMRLRSPVVPFLSVLAAAGLARARTDPDIPASVPA